MKFGLTFGNHLAADICRIGLSENLMSKLGIARRQCAVGINPDYHLVLTLSNCQVEPCCSISTWVIDDLELAKGFF